MASLIREEKNQERKDRTRGNLLDAAKRVFAALGYHQTLISNIVAEAGMGQGTFYRHFKDKREIFEALIGEFTERILGGFADMSQNLPENAAAYRAATMEALSRASAILSEDPDMLRLILREVPGVAPELEASLENLFDQFVALAKFYLDHAIERGFARHSDSLVVSHAIVGIAIRFITLWAKGTWPKKELSRVIKEIVDFAFDGLGSKNKKIIKRRKPHDKP